MKNDFILSATTGHHATIGALLERAGREGGNPALLRELFRCLDVAVADSHLSDKYASSLIASINGICRNCSEDARMASAALSSLESVFSKAGPNIRAYAADAACLLGTPQALRFILKAAEDPEVLRRCEIEEHIDRIIGIIYSVEPLSGLRELGRMLFHPSWDIRRYASGRLLLFGEPGQPEVLAQEAHRLLAKAAREGSFEARLFLCRGRKLEEFLDEWPHGYRRQRFARAACAFYERVKKGGPCAVPEGMWKRPRLHLAREEGFQRPPRKFSAGPERPGLKLVRGAKGQVPPR